MCCLKCGRVIYRQYTYRIRESRGYHYGISTLTKYHGELNILHGFSHYSDILSFITFHIKFVSIFTVFKIKCTETFQTFTKYIKIVSGIRVNRTVITETIRRIINSIANLFWSDWYLFAHCALRLKSSLAIAKVIYTKYSKHWPCTVAHTIGYVCRKC